MMTSRPLAVLLAAALTLLSTGPIARCDSVARQWNEALLEAIRIDFPAPTVHARNLYHTSAAMYDAWAAYDTTAAGQFYQQKYTATDRGSAHDEAISYAAYRVLSHRYALAVDPAASQQIFDDVMTGLGYDPAMTSTAGDTPSAVGNRIAAKIIAETRFDGSNESGGYADNTGYLPTNPAMTVDEPRVVPRFSQPLADPNRWQPLFLESSVLQNNLIGTNLQEYIGPHWGGVTTFAMGRPGVSTAGSGPYSWSSIDPGPAPMLGGVGDAEYRDDTVTLIRYSHTLDPTKGPGAETINLSPRVAGARPLGTHTDVGYATNPATGLPYADNWAKRADYGRVLAEYWADGPESETPPGHWNVIANDVSDRIAARRIGGTGSEVDPTEWDVKLYLALNGATHDAAVAAWGAKREYDYVRPITKVRYQGSLGQSSDQNLPSYHPDGLPLVDGLIELVTEESISEGGKHRNALENANTGPNGSFIFNYDLPDMIGKVVVNAWNHEPIDPDNELSGTDWILAENWVPYQKDNFVTPAFAAYVSGHSTFSRAAAEVLALFTGDEFFPGGLGEKTFSSDFLDFELGPSEPITLQWATYFDAADEAGISRLWGGIHVPVDDFAGREMGSIIGIDAYHFATQRFTGVPEPPCCVMLSAMLIGVLAKRPTS